MPFRPAPGGRPKQHKRLPCRPVQRLACCPLQHVVAVGAGNLCHWSRRHARRQAAPQHQRTGHPGMARRPWSVVSRSLLCYAKPVVDCTAHPHQPYATMHALRYSEAGHGPFRWLQGVRCTAQRFRVAEARTGEGLGQDAGKCAAALAAHFKASKKAGAGHGVHLWPALPVCCWCPFMWALHCYRFAGQPRVRRCQWCSKHAYTRPVMPPERARYAVLASSRRCCLLAVTPMWHMHAVTTVVQVQNRQRRVQTGV